MPHIRRMPDNIVRDEFAADAAQKLGIDSALFRQEIKQAAKQAAAATRKQAKREASRVGEQAWKDARGKGKKSLREAHAIAERAAYEAFRRMLDERHEAIRERHESFTRDDARER